MMISHVTGTRARVLIAIEPVVLEGAFAAILHSIGVDEVVQFHAATVAERARPFCVAIVSADLAAEVVADVVITLPGIAVPGAPTGPPLGHVTSDEGRVVVDIRDERQVIDLLDEHVPMGVSRRDELADDYYTA